MSFANCDALSSVILSGNLVTIGAKAFRRCSALTGITIPGPVTVIGDEAFACCGNLTAISIPASVTTLGNDIIAESTAITSINVEAGNRVYDSRGNCNAIIETASNTLLFGCQATIIPVSCGTSP